ncbi:hypothetical protein [Selenomonas sp. F0473]|uniref:hypothetical protein n=1 Tax=Selenomonas sp. F0473 TaxID=999423 RepID=UPI00029E1E2E|nr:hypothetical protein [Selenomonas sp. F0473]EKU70488.1 hypothetical protein HMPREF9161_01534 [Selenomonas sp. F0473]
MRARDFIGDERGAVSVLGLCVLTVLVLLALACVHFMRGGNVLAAEYERETQLRLAAESGVETAAAALEASADAYDGLPAPGERIELACADIPVTGDIEVRVFAEAPAPGQLYLIAAAVDHAAPHIDDGEGWVRGKIVRAYMEEKDHRYVWRRFF